MSLRIAELLGLMRGLLFAYYHLMVGVFIVSLILLSFKNAVNSFSRLRFLRYDPGEYFKPHMDGSYERENGERSLITVHLYLNEVGRMSKVL